MADSAADNLTAAAGCEAPCDGESAEQSAAAGAEVCPNCSAERTDTSVMWCRKCGYHPTLACVIDLVGEDLEQDESAASTAPAKPSATEGLAILVRMMPAWVRRSAMAAVSAALLGVFARLATEPESVARLICALALLLTAKLSIGTAHVWSYFYAVPESDRLSLADLLLRPFYVWSPTMRDIDLPGVWRRPAILVFGIVAEVVGLAVVGGVPWDRVWELGPAEPPKKQLVDAIANVGKEDEATDDNRSDNATAPARPRADCVIIGYVPSVASRLLGESTDEIDFSSLVLASDVRGRLRFVGVVADNISSEDRTAIRRRLKDLRRASPIIPCSVSANWIEPVLACRVSYARITSDNRFESIQYEKLLAELSL